MTYDKLIYNFSFREDGEEKKNNYESIRGDVEWRETKKICKSDWNNKCFD